MFFTKPKKSGLFVLDKFSVENIHKYKKRRDEILKYYWDAYSELAHKRAEIFPELIATIGQNCLKNYSFKKWQRILPYRWSLQPLSSKGSLIDPGGRFNIGEIDVSKFPPFPALYLAENRETAFQEKFCQDKDPRPNLSLVEMALAKKDSISCIAMNGRLEKVVDLTHVRNLKELTQRLAKIKLSKRLQSQAQRLKLSSQTAQNEKELLETLLDPYWRLSTMQYDVPANSQLFGQLVHLAKINGILYPSKFNQKLCLAIFPQTFKDSDSYVEIKDKVPAEVKFKRLDSSSFEFL